MPSAAIVGHYKILMCCLQDDTMLYGLACFIISHLILDLLINIFVASPYHIRKIGTQCSHVASQKNI